MPHKRKRAEEGKPHDEGPLRKCYTAVSPFYMATTAVKNLELDPSEKSDFKDTGFIQAIGAAMAWPYTFSPVKMAGDQETYNSGEARHIQGDELSLEGILDKCSGIRQGDGGKTVIDIILLDGNGHKEIHSSGSPSGHGLKAVS